MSYGEWQVWEGGGRYSDDIQGWVSGLVGEDYDAFLLSCDLNNLFLIGSQFSDISSSIFVEILLCTLSCV